MAENGLTIPTSSAGKPPEAMKFRSQEMYSGLLVFRTTIRATIETIDEAPYLIVASKVHAIVTCRAMARSGTSLSIGLLVFKFVAMVMRIQIGLKK